MCPCNDSVKLIFGDVYRIRNNQQHQQQQQQQQSERVGERGERGAETVYYRKQLHALARFHQQLVPCLPQPAAAAQHLPSNRPTLLPSMPPCVKLFRNKCRA